MRLTLLSRSVSVPSTARLAAAARARGHSVRVLDPVQVEMHLDGTRAQLLYRRRKVALPDVVLPRIAQSITTYGLAVVNQFGMLGVPVMNTASAIAQARNKMRCLQLLSAHGISVPATVMARSAGDLKAMVRLVGGVPVLVKLLGGADDRGVMVCETLNSLEAALEAILGLGHNLLVQEYVRKAGRDVRVLVVGGKALAAVRRRPRMNRLAYTLNRGARFERITLTEAQRRAAAEAARLIGLEVAAVDMLDVHGHPKVFEVHSSPGLAEMEKAVGQDLATPIVVRAEQIARERPPALDPSPLPAMSRRQRPAPRPLKRARASC
ncbi:MAG TPA: RimK family alpha-L-glutamate ligase [Myxococcaceae bacterium]|nr:RimK family alpha-L-glutamate ligase [Myxococcaceae bacterium]